MAATVERQELKYNSPRVFNETHSESSITKPLVATMERTYHEAMAATYTVNFQSAIYVNLLSGIPRFVAWKDSLIYNSLVFNETHSSETSIANRLVATKERTYRMKQWPLPYVNFQSTISVNLLSGSPLEMLHRRASTFRSRIRKHNRFWLIRPLTASSTRQRSTLIEKFTRNSLLSASLDHGV